MLSPVDAYTYVAPAGVWAITSALASRVTSVSLMSGCSVPLYDDTLVNTSYVPGVLQSWVSSLTPQETTPMILPPTTSGPPESPEQVDLPVLSSPVPPTPPHIMWPGM